MAPPSFASAAAGSNTNAASNRSEGTNEWARRANGATQTFRRPSVAQTFSGTTASTNTPPASNQQREIPSEAQPARYVPPHRNGVASDARYSRDQLLALAKSQHVTGSQQRDSLLSLAVGGWEPDNINGSQDSTGGWQRRDEAREIPGSDSFWDDQGSVLPRGLVDMTEEEKDIFTSSVNSPLKQLIGNRETAGKEGPLRRISVSNNPNSPGAFSLNSPSAARSTGRRQQGSESYPFPTQATNASKPRDTNSPPPSLRRRATDFNDIPDEFEEEGFPNSEGKQTIGHGVNPSSAGPGAPSSPWGATVPQSSGFGSPMGAFGNFGAAAAPGDKRPGLTGGRAESRFKGLMSKDSTDDFGKASKTPGKQGDNSNWRSAWPDTSRSGIDRDPDAPTGSAALGGGEEISPPPFRGLQNLGTPQRQDNRDDFGFGAFGMTPETGLKGLAHDQHGQHMRANPKTETMSPTNTNPYQSPYQDKGEEEDHDTDDTDPHIQLRGLGGFGGEELGQMSSNFGGGFQAFGQAPGDRSQTSSVGPRTGFSGLSGLGAFQGLGNVSGWGGLPAAAAPTLRSTGLGDGFGSAADLQSPSLAGLGSSNFFGSGQSAAPGAGRGAGKIGSMFQGADASRGDGLRQAQDDDRAGAFHSFPGDSELQDSSAFSGDEELLTSVDTNTTIQPGSHEQPQGGAAGNQPPTAQQRTMVMPDRMRWIYRDPQGNTQGPWSGLEMHDWYKAGFFSPELLVKKYEDTDYEPLAQLIRRIGNSREPFLVPQIGIPHGPPTSNWGSGPLPNSTGQPPFAASFPSFGTTLTADQQNALERRKQEEQYLMARQKEHLAQQQMAQRIQYQHQHGAMPHALQHHASAQSLQSQQSISSVGSSHAFPSAQLTTPTQATQFPGFGGQAQARPFGTSGAAGAGAGIDSLGNIREEGGDGDRNRAHQQMGQTGQDQSFQQQSRGQYDAQNHQHQVNAMLEDRAKLQAEQAQYDATHGQGQDGLRSMERLQEFQRLQNASDEAGDQQTRYDLPTRGAPENYQQTPVKEPRSLTEQVQQAVSAQQSPNAWGKVEALPQPFPPAPSQSPLPAPAAQRNRSHVADALHAESHSRSDTPSVETPSSSVAPWAKEPAEAPRGPSLREIQELEAKNAAKAEALAAEARRAMLEQEAQAQAAAAAAAGATPTVGLPSSSTWASTGSASPTNSGSAWAKAAKPVAAVSSAKSMAQIQKEEEARKKRLAAAQQQAAVLAGAAAQAQGKRYAELASKVASTGPASSATAPGGAWTTVGSSGKPNKVPGAPTPAPVRTPSAAAAPLTSAAAKKPAPIRSATAASGASTVNAQDEFKRWAAGELRGDLNKGVNAEEFISNLLAFPNELDIVTEAVHSVSTTIDSRHFAEAFLRRRKQAERGVFEPAATSGGTNSPANADARTGAGAGGWSEVAKKGGAKADGAPGAASPADDLAAFKVVAAKKKGAKR